MLRGFFLMAVGGLLFGFGWAITGACPSPLYAYMHKSEQEQL